MALTLPFSSASLPVTAAPLLKLTAPSSSGPLPPPFQLASSFSPIPGKLVCSIQALEFVEMRDLLPDNIALAERLEALPTHKSPAKAPETREVGALATWVTAFSTYIAVVAAVHRAVQQARAWVPLGKV